MYFITTIEHLPSGIYGKSNGTGDIRCVGYYAHLEDAEDTVINNVCDIWETIYNYCVIEEINEGIYSWHPSNYRKFYKFNIEEKKYEPIDEPKEFLHLVGFGIG